MTDLEYRTSQAASLLEAITHCTIQADGDANDFEATCHWLVLIRAASNEAYRLLTEEGSHEQEVCDE